MVPAFRGFNRRRRVAASTDGRNARIRRRTPSEGVHRGIDSFDVGIRFLMGFNR
jgi:hypothetical protein